MSEIVGGEVRVEGVRRAVEMQGVNLDLHKDSDEIYKVPLNYSH